MATIRRKRRSLADYDHPPVVEVVYGVRFTPFGRWKLPHIGAFWERVAAKFPRCEHAPPIGSTDIADIATGFPLPRVWLINATEDRLVQLQSGRFLFNWRYREDIEPYPHYVTLSKEFFALFKQFREFLAEHDLGDVELLECELTYINHIREQEGWRFPDHLGRVVEQVDWQDRLHQFLPRPSEMGWHARFPFQDQSGNLSIKVNPATRVTTTGERRLLVLEISARGLPAETPLEHMKDWFSHGHEWIVHGFEDLTSEESQRELWGKHERRRSVK